MKHKKNNAIPSRRVTEPEGEVTSSLDQLMAKNPALYKALIEQVAAEKSLYAFTELMWEYVEPANPFVGSWHIEAICEHLEAVTNDHITRLLINIPPGCMKSLLVDVFWPAWEWIKNPSQRYICTSYSQDLTERDNNRFKQVVNSDLYKAMWGSEFDLTSFSVGKVQNSKTGWKLATSCGGVGTGERAGRVLVDDPHNVKDSESETVRNSTIRYFEEVLPTRLTNPDSSAIIVIMQRVHECLLPGTKISTLRGMISCEDLLSGDEVLTTHGSQKILATASRNYSGGVTSVKVFGSFNDFIVTNNHPILTVSGWKEAGKLSNEDTLIFPIFKNSTGKREMLRLWPKKEKRKPPKKVQTVTGHKGRVDKKTIEKLLDDRKTSSEIAKILGFKNRQMVDSYISAFGISRKVGVDVDKKIILSPDFWRIVGYWLAEGSFVNNRKDIAEKVIFTFSRDEMRYAEDIKNILGSYGIKVNIGFEPSVIKVNFSSIQFAQFLSLFGRGAKNKFLPEWAIRLPKKYAKELLIGYWGGDGSFNDKECLVRFGSASIGLIEGVSKIFHRLGAVPSIYKNDKKTSTIKSGHRKGHIINGGESYELRVSSSSCRWMGFQIRKKIINKDKKNKIINGQIHIAIKSLERSPYKGMVYDIQTHAENFLSGYITAHNCDISGTILDKDLGYTHLMLPMEFDEQRKCTTYFPDGTLLFEDPRTEQGELLFEKRFPSWVIERDKKVMGPYAVAGQFQQIPTPRGGGIIKRDWWQVWPPEDYPEQPDGKLRYPAMDYIIMSCDTAYTNKQENDYSACVVLGVFRHKGNPKIMLMEAWQERLEFHDLVQKIIVTAKKRKVDAVLVESKASGLSVRQEIVRLCGEEEFNIHPINPGAQDKVARMHSVVPLFSSGCVYAPDKQWAEDVITNVAKFPKGAHDDMADSISQGVGYLRKIGLALLSQESDTIQADSRLFRGSEDNERLYDV